MDVHLIVRAPCMQVKQASSVQEELAAQADYTDDFEPVSQTPDIDEVRLIVVHPRCMQCGAPSSLLAGCLCLIKSNASFSGIAATRGQPRQTCIMVVVAGGFARRHDTFTGVCHRHGSSHGIAQLVSGVQDIAEEAAAESQRLEAERKPLEDQVQQLRRQIEAQRLQQTQ